MPAQDSALLPDTNAFKLRDANATKILFQEAHYPLGDLQDLPVVTSSVHFLFDFDIQPKKSADV